ncbi:D-alanyl-D-alanine carboxypeptidase family protein [Aureimonas leprariae]|uniref:D-alanyl-D-alanine carboxypeptidase n=1 Tax=Plantimonas leprariae TaxID=2615207 RepID=A0A7V7PNT2_9HYPH|nr:D-alanyl-D-alanine carboxypeptidase family protein [Aureimonas leprariae]KAB0679539.1 D-alanyl-D-alanine carboxypeptidase [Aureimonas leprariae]
MVLLLAGALPAAAEQAVVADVATAKVLYAQNASSRWYPASTTKLMTAYVALKAIEDGKAAVDTPVVMTRYAASQAPSKMGFQPGSVMRLDVALRMMLVKSANDVAVAIGEAVGGGSLETFVGMMNEEAAAIGMKDSRFVNPNGLPGEGQHSSAKDLALLAVKLRTEFPTFATLFGTEAISTGAATIKNTNGLLGRFDGADGMKTGYICASGFNLVGSATRDGRTVVAVVLGASGTIVRDRRVAELLDLGFKADPAKETTLLADLAVANGDAADISGEICSAAGRKERAEAREDEAERKDGSPGSHLHEMDRARSVVRVSLGGAAAAPGIEAGITQIANYNIPVPMARPPYVPEKEGPPLPPGFAASAGREGPPLPSDAVAVAPAAPDEGDGAN